MMKVIRSRRRTLVVLIAGVVAAVAAALVPAVASAAPAAGQARAVVASQAGSASGPAEAANPKLTANTPAPCNATPKPGHAQCFAIVRTPSDHTVTADTSGPPSTALTPADIQSAYDLPSATAGGGQTLADVIWGDDPDLESDLAVFRSQFGLPPCTTANGCFRKVNQEGQQSNYPTDQGTSDETSLDVDAFSAACPNCNILVVEANSNSFSDIGAAEDEAVTLGATVVSNSYGGTEDPSETSLDQYYNHPGVAITASAGDGGYGVNYPSASQYVTAVGGTYLTQDTSVPRGWDETVWNGQGNASAATGSGCSAYEPQPSWQAGVTQDCAMRATADVSADAAPASGLAVYDTDGEGGWLQIGGTSLASPLIAATYALAGLPAAGTYPSSYVYAHYQADPSAFNDITSGSNGDCGNVLCNAGPGWDGPTGLGTPDGVSGFAYTQAGSITGTVTDASTGQPVSGATVSVPRLSVITGSDGSYTLSGLPPGSYQVSVSGYGYQTSTATVTVTANQATTQNFALTGSPHETVSGTVTAGTGAAWPLYAQVSWTDGNGHSGTTYTNPATGQYSLSLLENGSYTLSVTAQYPDTPQGPAYEPGTATVAVATSNVTQNFALTVNLLACTAIGYSTTLPAPQDFDSTSTPAGWQVTNTSLHLPYYTDQPGWQFDNPGDRANTTGGSGNFAIVDSDHDGQFHYQDTDLVSPVVDMSAATTPAVQFDTDYEPASNSTATVDVSVDGGKTWTNVWTSRGFPGTPGPATVVVPLTGAAGKPDVRVRFGYTGQWSQWWEIDDVSIGQRTCAQQSGGLVVGRVADGSGNAVNGATVASVTNPAETATTVATPGDSVENGGLYELFVTGTGSQQFTASDAGYTSSTQTATVTAGQVSTLNFTLAASAALTGAAAGTATQATGTTAIPHHVR